VGGVHRPNASVVADKTQAVVNSDPSQKTFQCTRKPVHFGLESRQMGIHPNHLLGSLSQVGDLGFKPSKPFVDV
jgi:hypothetical protein